MLTNEEQEKVFSKESDIIANVDCGEAKQLLSKISGLSYSDPKIDILRKRLSIVALPVLPESQALEVLKSCYLLSYQIGVSMEDQITAALFVEPLLSRDELRKKFQKAMLENRERIGNLTIGQWIQKFENKFDIRARDEFALVRFLMQDENAAILDQIEIKKLKDVLHDYDCLLTATLPATEPRLSKIIKRQHRGKTSDSGKVVVGSNADRILNQNTQMPLQEALKKFEKLGEQLLSGNPIKLKIFSSPVRPSIKNWIADYYEKLEARRHDSIERGNYLFHSENARRLTTGERQKVGTMLRALDEETLVTVDPGRQEVFFQSENSELETSRIQKAQDTDAFRNTKTPLPTLSPLRRGEEEAAGGMNFSSPHKFPTERSVVRPGSFPQSGQQPRAGKNVVDLREQ